MPRQFARRRAQYYNRALSLTGEDLLTEENIFVGNGSDEVLALLFPAFFKGKKIAFADITYSFYPVYCSLFEVSYELLPLQEVFPSIWISTAEASLRISKGCSSAIPTRPPAVCCL